jgi:MATE family multidrug resistance protein
LTPGGYRELLTLAVPLMISSGTQSLMHIIDRILLTWYSHDALAAALPAGIVYWTVLSLPFGVAQYVNTFVAQYEGAGRKERVAASVWNGAYFAILSGGVLTLAAPLGFPLFRWIGHEGGVAALEAEYFYWLCWGAIPALLTAALSCFFSGRGQMLVVSAVNMSGVLINIILDCALIFGWGPFPRWGIAGAAIATNLSSCACVTTYVGLLLFPAIERQYRFLASWRPDLRLCRRMMRYGLPSGYNLFIDIAGFTAFVIIVGWLGKRELAATNIAFNLNTLAFIPVLGMSIAVSTLVGQRIGEGRPDLAEKSARRAFHISGSYMLLFGLVYVGMPNVLIMPYARHANGGDVPFEEIHSVAIVLLRFVALYSFFDAMAIIFGSAVRAAGDTVFSMRLTLCCSGLLLVLPTYLVWQLHGPSLIWSWVFCAAYVIAMGLGFLARFRQGRWKSMRVIEPAPDDLLPEVSDEGELLSDSTVLAESA